MDLGDSSSKCEHATVFDDVVNGWLLVAALHPAVSMMRHLCIRSMLASSMQSFHAVDGGPLT